MTRKSTSLLTRAMLITGLALAFSGCVFAAGSGGNSAAPLSITFVNQSDDVTPPVVFVFARNAIPGFNAMAEGVAWRVMPGIGHGSSHTFRLMPMSSVQAMWSTANRTMVLPAEVGKKFDVIENDTGIVLIPNGNASQPNAIEITSQVNVTGGIQAQLLNDNRLLMQKSIVAYGQKATFVFDRKLYWGVASEIQEGQLIGTAILSTNAFFQQDLNGVRRATVTLTGSAVSGYHFEVAND